MKLLRLTIPDRSAMFAQLSEMPAFLELNFAGLSAVDAATPGPDGAFSPVEQVWHLADLENEGYAVRIRRLLAETFPVLEDFDGDRVAAERQYRTRSLDAGLAAFRSARRQTLLALQRLSTDAWERTGVQEGVGAVSLCDIPLMMAGHDASHRAEVLAWISSRRPSS